MKVAIHQPQYLPWLPYLLKVDACDLFILLDSVDFQKNGLQNRNQIKTAQGAHWLTVPVQQRLGQKICDVRINGSVDWRRKHWQTIQQCYRKAGAFARHGQELEAVFAREWGSLCELNVALTTMMLRWMEIPTPVRMSSAMQARGNASELVLQLCQEVHATQYISGTGGRSYLEEAAFRRAGIDIDYQESRLPVSYPQQFPQAGFIPALSALDILLNCGPQWRSYVPETVGLS